MQAVKEHRFQLGQEGDCRYMVKTSQTRITSAPYKPKHA
jgi:hypothetical protein